jgi:hypothetical protein
MARTAALPFDELAAAAFCQQILDITEAEGEPGIKPDGLLNNHRWEAISDVADFGHDRRLMGTNHRRQAQQRDNADDYCVVCVRT